MLSMTTRSNGGKDELIFDAEDGGVVFTVLIGGVQHDFELSLPEWIKLKEFIDGAKNTEQPTSEEEEPDHE